jgi:hypothetical protein
MTRTVKISISGRGPDTDAPLIEDALDEIRDWVEILRGVEEAAAGSPGTAIDWRLVNASRNSPFAFEIAPFPRQFATNIDRRVEIIVEETARGLFALQTRAERPRHFTDEVMRKARRVMERVTNGLGSAAIEFGPDLPMTRITPTIARAATRNVDLVLESPDKPYREVGSVEGYLQSVERDGFGRRIAHVVERVTGQPVKCIMRGDALAELETREIRDIWRSQRVNVSGLIHFEGFGKIDRIDAEHVRFMRARSELPQIDDILDPDFTGGTESVEYVRRLRDGTLPQTQ